MNYLRIMNCERPKIQRLAETLNRQRLDCGKPVLKDSEILHELLKIAFSKIRVEDGEILI